MTAATDTMPALPEPHGYVGACNHYCLQPKDSPLMPEKLNRWTAHQVRAYGDQRAEQARAKDQPTPAQIEALAHRMCSRYQAPRVYTFNGTTLLEFAQALLRGDTP